MHVCLYVYVHTHTRAQTDRHTQSTEQQTMITECTLIVLVYVR
jgi:hypothetical protein